MEVKPGYKITDAGALPDEWQVKLIQELIDDGSLVGHLDGNHGELYPRSHEFKAHGVPYISANDFADGKVDFGSCKYLSLERASQFRKGVAISGDVLFAHNATVGPVALLESKEPFVILSTTATYFRCASEELVNSYLKFALQSKFFVRQYQAVMAQSTRFQVPITTQRKLSLVLPPFNEQKAIATALSDVDALIDGLTQLIAKKRNLKQAAMQQLLTGKTRLPGFGGGWVVRRLGEIVRLYQPETISASKFTETGFPVYGANGVVGYYHSANHETWQVTVTCRGSTCGTVNRTAERSWITGNAMVLNCDDSAGFDKQFLYYLMLGQDLSVCITGTGQPQIVRSPLADFQLLFPNDIHEQAAIAKVLSDMDAELAALESRLAKTRALKQGMMQELLTGRTRLVNPADNKDVAAA